MKLYSAPWACSMSDHMALIEAGAPFEFESVDLKTKTTGSGESFFHISAKGYVPALVLDDGQVLSENIAVLDFIASRHPQLAVDGALGRTRLLEALAFIGTELHQTFEKLFGSGDEMQKDEVRRRLAAKLGYLSETIEGDYLFGARPSVADFYLLVMLIWAARFQVPVTPELAALRTRLLARPAVQRALSEEGVLESVLANAA